MARSCTAVIPTFVGQTLGLQCLLLHLHDYHSPIRGTPPYDGQDEAEPAKRSQSCSALMQCGYKSDQALSDSELT